MEPQGPPRSGPEVGPPTTPRFEVEEPHLEDCGHPEGTPTPKGELPLPTSDLSAVATLLALADGGSNEEKCEAFRRAFNAFAEDCAEGQERDEDEEALSMAAKAFRDGTVDPPRSRGQERDGTYRAAEEACETFEARDEMAETFRHEGTKIPPKPQKGKKKNRKKRKNTHW